MDRIDGANNVDIGGGLRGFRKRNAAAGVAGTELTEDWLNDVQEELLKVIVEGGIFPEKGVRDQLYRAILQLIANYSVGGTGTSLTLEQVRDAVAAMIQVSPLMSISYNDPADTLTISFTLETLHNWTAAFVSAEGLLTKEYDQEAGVLRLGVAADLLAGLAAKGTLVGFRVMAASKTWVPTAGATTALLLGCGGGGAGGGAQTGSHNTASHGGGSGEVRLMRIAALAASYSVVIGSGGAGKRNARGGDGGSTIVKQGATQVFVAKGGKGGETWASNGWTGGQAGTGGVGGIRVAGTDGTRTWGSSVPVAGGSGMGGGNCFGPGAPSTFRYPSGIAATAPGTGGSGADGHSAGANGGVGGRGAAGILIILEFR